MKTCSYCGNEYSDGVTVCPLDGRPVISSQAGPGKVVTSPQGVQPVFDVRLVSPILSAGKYRVFIAGSDLVFIQMEGGLNSISAAVAPLLGPMGNLIPLVLWLVTSRDTKAKRRRLEARDPEELLRESKANFKLNLAEIRDATVEAPSRFVATGKAGRLNLVVRHGEGIKCEFENVAEMTKAIQLLASFLGPTLRVHVVWNEEKRRFDREKKDLTH